MTGALAGEWTKLHTTRAPWWTALVALLGIGGIGVAIAFTSKEQVAPSMLLGGASLGMLVVMVLAALAATSDHATGTHRLSLMADAHRVRLFAAKAAVVSAVCALLGALGGGILALAAAGSAHVSSQWRAEDVRGIAGQIVVWGLAGLMAVSIGTIVRKTALAITVVTVWPVVVEGLISLIPKVGHTLVNWTPFTNATLFTSPSLIPGSAPHGPMIGLAVFAAWAIALAVVAAAIEARRDA